METKDIANINQMPNKDKIAVLVSAILQPAIAGGLHEKEAEKIYNNIMSNISKLHSSENQFNDLLKDILNKWALPIIAHFGANVNNILPDSHN